jgi:predicted RNA-binding protein with PIN domain
MSLEEQLRDDPRYAGLDENKFKKEVEKHRKEYLGPLKCIDRYLTYLKREELYKTVSTGLGDPEGRWQAFHDYYNFIYQKLENEKMRIKLGIHEDEIGSIEDAAFKIIRMREFPNMSKVHKIMRDLPKWLTNDYSKKELLKLKEVNMELPREDKFDNNGNEYKEPEIDKIWGKKNATTIVRQVKEAKYGFEYTKEKETPIDLLEAALKKLTHANLKPNEVGISDYSKAMRIARAIQERANELENEFYSCQKRSQEQLRKLTEKHKK